jgi:transcriptional antiterminator RfaH
MVNLERQGYESYLPMFAVQKIFRRELAVAQEPMFARYLFVRIDPDGMGQGWQQIRSTIGVSRLVRFGEQPARVEDALIRDIRQHEMLQNEAPRSLFVPGEKIVITSGSLAGLEAIYQAQDGSGRATVLLEILSRRVTMQVDSLRLRKVK